MPTPPIYEIPDPGNGGAIETHRSGVCHLVTTGAQTRTVADPALPGLDLALYFHTDGGDCVVTFASAVNAGGNNTLTHDTAGETVFLRSVRDGSVSSPTYAWKILSNPATTPLSTV